MLRFHSQLVPRQLTQSFARQLATKKTPPPDDHEPKPKHTKELIDEACDPSNPRELRFSQICIAHHRIKNGIIRTDCRHSNYLSRLTGMDVHLKMEVNQVTGSFKERGARWALMNLTEQERKIGVWAASAGNHALALSRHGGLLGVPVNVVMPRFAPIMKVSKCEELGSNVTVDGEDINESRIVAMQMAKEKGGKYVNGYDHIDILAGAGTVGLEICEDLRDIDAVLVPAGGCGLIAGVSAAINSLSPNTQVIAVASENCPSIKTALDAGRPTYTKARATLADGLAVPTVGVNSFETLKKYVKDVVLVKERDIAVAILRLIECEKVVCEGAGAIGVAALLSGQLEHLRGKRVVSILTGGNIDSTALGRSIERGMAHDHRLIRFNVVVSDRPGGVAELCQHIAKTGASIKEMFMERAFLRTDVFSVRVKVIAETRGKEHMEELAAVLNEVYTEFDCSRAKFYDDPLDMNQEP